MKAVKYKARRIRLDILSMQRLSQRGERGSGGVLTSEVL
jgi:hypothetical protein